MITVILSFLLVSTPLTVTHDDNDVGELVKEDFSLVYLDRLFVNNNKLELQMDILNEKIYQAPTNAKLNDNGEIVEEKPGKTLDRVKFQQLFQDYFYKENVDKISLPEREIYPRVDSELLAEIREKEIGSYLTYFKVSNKERSHNISLAAEAIDNYVVFPGEKFSFNKVVGKRTKERGYKRAPVIVKGELAEDTGGGICQVSSTLYNAVELKGIQIVERYSHSRSVPYVPPGRDATVSWYGPDFVFKNNYNQPILIRASADEGKMKISIYSSESL
ncbi:VanW family protein [Virgibacillus doumboii]|uniref:VanW family protein n=1 Tax=Virgibacillus doumboii TaxID=2697503 RepID=UPI0013DEF837|nr:VanW family protein [Virgibacillus doumboii]